jgi:hypothetical protein
MPNKWSTSKCAEATASSSRTYSVVRLTVDASNPMQYGS